MAPNLDDGETRRKFLHASIISHKSKISQIEEDAFEIGAVRHAAQFMRFLLNTVDFMLIKFNK